MFVSEEHQARNNPHFSGARSDTHFFVYLSLSELGLFTEPDYALLSQVAPLTAFTVVECSSSSSIEYWDDGTRVWYIGGASGQGYEVLGDVPVDLIVEAARYRENWNSLPHDPSLLNTGELKLPEGNDDLVYERFSSLIDAYWARTTEFTPSGNHPDLYRMTGEFPTQNGGYRE